MKRPTTHLHISQPYLVKILVRLAFSITLVTLSIREFLFGNGLYVYRDWTWPLSTSLTPVANFSPDILRNSGPDPMGFARIFVTWPIVLIDGLTSDVILAEKAYVLYLFSLFICLYFIFAELLVRSLCQKSGVVISQGKRELLVLSIVLSCFINFWSLAQLSDFYYTYMIEFGLIGIALLLVLTESRWAKTAVLPGALLSLCVFLDPNLYPFGLIAVAVSGWGKALMKPARSSPWLRSLGQPIVAFLVTLPSLMTMLFVFDISTGTNARAPYTYLTDIGNLSFSNASRLLGYWWSLIAYSPPSIITSGHANSTVDSIGFPPYMLLPPGPMLLAWSVSTWSVPVLALGTTILSPLRKLTIPIAAVACVGLLFTQPLFFPYPFQLATALAGVPLVGGAIVTFLAIPDHALIIVSVSYTILIGVGLYGLLTANVIGRLQSLLKTRSKPVKSEEIVRGQVGLVILVLALLIFSGWQLFSGSLYPSGYVWGGAGNGVSNIGAFSPSQPPAEMFQVYQWLMSQPGTFNIYWPGANGAAYPWSQKATGPITFIDSPRPTVFPRALPFLIGSDLVGGIKDYLAALNVRYLVVQPFSSVAMQYAWGATDSSVLNEILQSAPGITPVESIGQLLVYRVEGTWGDAYPSPLVLGYNANDSEYALAFGSFASLGTRVAFTDMTTAKDQLCIDSSNCPIILISPMGLALESSLKTSQQTLTDTSTNMQSLVLQPARTAQLPSPTNSWSVTNWGPSNASVAVQSGDMSWLWSGVTSYLTLSFNGTLTAGHPGGISINPDQLTTTQTHFWYRSLDGFDGSLQIVIPQLDSKGLTITESASPIMTPSAQWAQGTYTAVLSSGARYFTARFAAKGSRGSVEIRNAGLDYASISRDSNTTFGSSLPSPGNFEVNLPPGYTYIQFQGSGSLIFNGQNNTLASPEGMAWLSLPFHDGSPLILSGNMSIGTVLISSHPLRLTSVSGGNDSVEKLTLTEGSSVVVARLFAQGYALSSNLRSYSPIPTLDGLTLFQDASPGVYSVSLTQINQARAAYFASLGLTLGLIVGPHRSWLVRVPKGIKALVKHRNYPRNEPLP